MHRQLAAVVIVTATVIASVTTAEEPRIVVTANRDRRDAAEVPASITVLTATDIKDGGYNNVVDVLRDAEGVVVRSTSGNAAQSEVGMRGFGENSFGRVLVLLDGVRLNRPDMAAINWLQVPLSNVDRIEVVRGGNSSLYGDNALAGVINIITRKGTKETVGSLRSEVGSFDSATHMVEVSGSSGEFSYALNAQSQSTDGYRMNSAYSSWGAGANVEYDFSETINAALALSWNSFDYGMPAGLTREQMAENPCQTDNPDDHTRNEDISARAVFNMLVGESGRATISCSFGRRDISTDLVKWSSYSDVIADTFGVSPAGFLDVTFLGMEHRLMVGLDYYRDRLGLQLFSDIDRSAETVHVDVDKDTLGFYYRDEVALSDSFILETGGRIESSDIAGRIPGAFDDSKTHQEDAMDIALAYLFGDQSKVFGRAGTVFRYPFVDEQVSYYGSAYFNRELTAESGRSFELGADVAVADGVRAGMTAFLLDMKDEIAVNAATWQNENLDNTRRSGIEARLRWAMEDRLTIDANCAYTRAVFLDGENEGKHVPLVPRSSASVTASWPMWSELHAKATVSYVDGSFLGGDFANAGDKLDARTVVDLMLRYAPAGGIEAYIAIDNVLGEKYASTGYSGGEWTDDLYYPAPERTFRAGFSCGF
ncbi:MAG: TonB-dependent receptor [Lentisphaerales bacterium]|jgi:iron complex outermembrane receptor protein|nr:MAG: TonB-dependent receptor [Lentisphaerales bacterium]